jgi:hypothetical protein
MYCHITHKRKAITATAHGIAELVTVLMVINTVQIAPREVARKKAMIPDHTTAGIRAKSVRLRFMPP